MPLTFQRTFRVRFHDCDINQTVRDASWLRYMQEAAFAASDAVGYTEERYRAIHRIWLIRETTIDLLHPLRYGDSVQVTTWVDDFHKVRSRRAYEMRDSRSEALVATASTDWVLLDLDSGWPAVIPDEMIEAFTPNSAPSKTLARRRFPAAPPPANPHRQQQAVQWRDLDSAGHVNNAVYVDYLEDAARQDLAALGWPAGRLNDLGLDIATRQLRMEYRLPALLGDELILTTWTAEIAEETGMRYTTVVRGHDDEVLFQARATWGCLDLHTRQRAAIPAALAAELAARQASG